MIRTTLLGTAVLLTLAGCARISDSRLNPVNWFGSSTEEQATAPDAIPDARPLVPEGQSLVIVDGRALVQTITALTVDRGPAGAIVTATGVAPTQGYFNAQLVNSGVSNGVLTLQFRAQPPAGDATVGSDRSRQISAAYIISAGDLAGIQTVRVEAATNARTAGR